MAGQEPIGWWVERLDVLTEQVVDRTVGVDGLTRRHWQVLTAEEHGATVAAPARIAADVEPALAGEGD